MANDFPGSAQSASSRWQTLAWRDGVLELIDQRVLPGELKYFSCNDAGDTAYAIRNMVVRGAPAIGCAAAYGVALEAMRQRFAPANVFMQSLIAAFQLLADSRPTAVNLMWALDRQRRTLDAVNGAQPAEIASALLSEANAILAEDIEVNLAIGRHGTTLIPHGARILTHCNAGALATAGHGTALGVIRSAIAAGKRVQVFADETRPLLQGARLTAWELMQDGIAVTLIADSAAGSLMSNGQIDVVIVGADRVTANGDTANKIGTYPLAVMAQRHGLPFYVACPLSTIDPAMAHGRLIPIEERSPEEVTMLGGQRVAAAGVAIRNPAFDVTPAQLITALITERGVVHRPDCAGISALFATRTV